ncbi:MAG: O-antigen ligase family protein [Christensenellaceae bacterium]
MCSWYASISFMMPESRRDKLLYGMTLIANLVSLYICNCRSSLMVVMIVTPVLLIIHRRYRWAAVDLMASLAIVLLLKVEPGLFQRMEESGHDFLVRQSIWENALKGFLETPLLGRGPLGYMELAQAQGLTFRVHAHNVTLDLLLNYGLLGASLLAAYFSGVGKTLWMLLKTRTDNHLCAMALGLVAAVAIHGMTDVTIFSLQVGLLFVLLIGCTGIYERDWVGQKVYRFRPKSVQTAEADAGMRLRNRKG